MMSSTPIVVRPLRCERLRIRRHLAIVIAGAVQLAGCSPGAQHAALPGVAGITSTRDMNRIAPQFRLALRPARNNLLHGVAGIKMDRVRGRPRRESGNRLRTTIHRKCQGDVPGPQRRFSRPASRSGAPSKSTVFG